MDKIKGGTETCKNKVTRFNQSEDCYFGEMGALTLSDPNECEQLVSIETIKTLVNLCQNLGSSFQSYVSEHKLDSRWRREIETMKIFESRISNIRSGFEYAVEAEIFKELITYQQEIINLRTEIKNSKAFLKYLEHQEVTRLLNKGTDKDHSVLLSKAAQIISELNNEEELEMAKIIFQKVGHLLFSKPEVNQDHEEIKDKYSEETKDLNEKDSQEISDLKGMHDQEKEIFSKLYEQNIGSNISIDENSEITFDLRHDSWMNLLKALSESKLPITKEYRLDYIPANSEFVKMFMSNLSQGQNQFRFNLSCNIKLESGDYIEALKQAASRTANVFLVNHSNFSVKDFCDFVIAASNVQKVGIENGKIPMDSEFEFGEQLTSCSIQHLSLKYSGHINHSNWEANPHRFENLLKAISKCEPLKNSLKTLDLELGGISKKKADEYRIQYGLNELKLKGFNPF